MDELDPWAVRALPPPAWALKIIKKSRPLSGGKRILGAFLTWLHCLWGVVRLKPCRMVKIREVYPGPGWRMTYRYYYGCDCGWVPFPRRT